MENQKMKRKSKKAVGKFTYCCEAGIYDADSMIGLIWAIFKHRFYHLIKDGKWQD